MAHPKGGVSKVDEREGHPELQGSARPLVAMGAPGLMQRHPRGTEPLLETNGCRWQWPSATRLIDALGDRPQARRVVSIQPSLVLRNPQVVALVAAKGASPLRYVSCGNSGCSN